MKKQQKTRFYHLMNLFVIFPSASLRAQRSNPGGCFFWTANLFGIRSRDAVVIPEPRLAAPLARF